MIRHLRRSLLWRLAQAEYQRLRVTAVLVRLLAEVERIGKERDEARAALARYEAGVDVDEVVS